MADGIQIDEQETVLGNLSVWHQPHVLDPDRHAVEIRLNGWLLMTDAANASEAALATESLAELDDRESCKVLVGGLGMGYTAEATLRAANVESVTVVEFIPAVIDWHRQGVFPMGTRLLDDPRCEIVQGDFFSMIGARGHGDGDFSALGRYDAILLDIDDAPSQHLHEAHRDFYAPEGLRQVISHLEPGGVFGLWSFGPEDGEPYEETLAEVFREVRVHEVPHHDPTWNQPQKHLVYIAKSPR